MGKFVYKTPPERTSHVHDYPHYLDQTIEAIQKGDIWQCLCGRYFQVDKINDPTQDGQTIDWRGMWPEELSKYNL